MSAKQNQKQPFSVYLNQWNLLGFYEKFEQTIAFILGLIIALVIVISLVQLTHAAFVMLVLDADNPLDQSVFQSIFGMIMTLMIAMEFKHSIIRVALRSDSIIQVKTVLLIAMIALSRKLVLIEANTEPAKIVALSVSLLCLGLVYWLLRERDDRLGRDIPGEHG